MSPSTDTKFKVEPFDGSNYSLWSYKMKMYLMSKGLWEAVSGEAGSTAKEQQAHAAIVLNLNDSQLMHVVTSTTAKEAWDTLKKFHKTQDMANRLWLKEKFSAFKFTASSVGKHTGNAPVPAPSSTPAASGDSTQPPPDSASPPDASDVEKRPPEDSSQPSSGESQAIILRQPDGDDSAENVPVPSENAGGSGVSPIPMGEGVVLPSFSRPRHVRMEDVDALFFKGVLSQQTIRPENFAPPDSSARWTLPSLPDTGTKTYLVGVPATVDDTRGGGFTMNGYGGTTALIGFEEMNADDNSEFERLFDMNARQYLLQARQDPLRLDALTSSLDDIGTRREFASILTHFPPDQLASRVFRTSMYLRLVLGDTVDFGRRLSVVRKPRLKTLWSSSASMVTFVVNGSSSAHTGTKR
uniref:Uncharacterized protein n=1 Tax=Phytophthora ramorum TaxID=164328 RepID=H3GFU7_PHYRM